ncbi:MAG: polysaccharide deacetylase family protein [Myxococcota bacterium]
MGWRQIGCACLVAFLATNVAFGQPLVAAMVRPVVEAELEVPAEEARDPFASELANGRITRGFIRHRMIHFTFDDGPRLDTTPALLDHLDEAGVRATFFVVARGFDGRNRVDRAKAELLRDVARRGHTIGAHTYDHSRLTSLGEEAIVDQLVRSEEIIERVLGDRPVLFRAPYGARDARVDQALADRGYTHVLWNITSADVSSRSADQVVSAFRDSLDRRERHPRGPGGIVLLHDTKPWVVEAFPQMINELRDRNCGLLEEEGEELWDVLDDASFFHQERGESASQHARTVELEEAIVEARQEVLREEARAWCEARDANDVPNADANADASDGAN